MSVHICMPHMICAVFRSHYLFCFQYTFVSKLKLCFQYTDYVSNLIPMFPIYKLCFQYPMYVSNIHFMFPNSNDVSKRQCFQCMFPIYMEPFFKITRLIWRQKRQEKTEHVKKFTLNKKNRHWTNGCLWWRGRKITRTFSIGWNRR